MSILVQLDVPFTVTRKDGVNKVYKAGLVSMNEDDALTYFQKKDDERKSKFALSKEASAPQAAVKPVESK